MHPVLRRTAVIRIKTGSHDSAAGVASTSGSGASAKRRLGGEGEADAGSPRGSKRHSSGSLWSEGSADSGDTPRSGGATPRGTPRSASGLYRDGSLSKRRRVQVRGLVGLLMSVAAAAAAAPACTLSARLCRQRPKRTNTRHRPTQPSPACLCSRAAGVRCGRDSHAAGGAQVCGAHAGVGLGPAAASPRWPLHPMPLLGTCACAARLPMPVRHPVLNHHASPQLPTPRSRRLTRRACGRCLRPSSSGGRPRWRRTPPRRTPGLPPS